MKRVMTLLLGVLAMVWLVPGRANDTVYYYYTNTLHSAVVETNAQGTVVETTYYAPYGQVLNRSLRDGPGYTGHEEDPETGLNYMQQRYYDPQSGRFLSTDPVPTSGGGGNFNRYWYASDNPYTYTDTNGEQDCVPTPKGSKGGTKCGPPTTGCLTQGCSASANTSIIIVDDSYRRGADVGQQQTQIETFAWGEANAYGMPGRLGEAVLLHENPRLDTSAHYKNSNGTTDYGLMMVNSINFGSKITDMVGRHVVVSGSKVRSDWRYNIYIGMHILNESYRFAQKYAPNDIPAATYARYNSWSGWKDFKIPGTEVYKHVQAFLKVYNSIGGP